MKSIRLLLCFLSMCLCGSSAVSKEKEADLKVIALQCDYETNPLGIDALSPQLSWQIESTARGIMQSAYRIVVSSSQELLAADNGDVWDSDRVNSSQSTGVLYKGTELSSCKRYYWKVMIWTPEGVASRWSEPAFFEMGLLKQEEWQGGWIGYVPGLPGRVLYFKGTFVPEKQIKQARAYVSGIGLYDLYINKKKVGDHVLDPAQSTYSKRAYYVTYDISEYLTEPVNIIVIPVAGGWYGTPRLRVQLDVEFTDGSHRIVTANELRRVTAGPTTYTSIFDGEQYDARLENEDLHKPGVPPGLMNKEWAFAHNTDDPTGKMVSQRVEPIKIVETLTPVSVTQPSAGVYVFDAGRNLAGWASLRVQGKAGDKVTLRFAETLYEDGTINQENLRNAKAEDTYILKGGGVEEWEPAFTYHGFRYVQVEGLPSPPQEGDIQIKVVRTAVKQTGKFNSSNPLLNDIHRMVLHTEAANLHSVPTDCPQRDERMGWLNDLTVRIEQAIYNFDMSRFYAKYIADVSDTQDAAGTITCVAPFRFGMRPADPVCASYLLLAQKSYEFYGDSQVITDHFDGMKGWVDYLRTRTQNGIVDYSYYGDWCPPRDFLMDPNGSGVSRDTPGQLISTGYLYYCERLLAEMATVIGKEAVAQEYAQLAEETASAFNREFWNEQTEGYGSNNQACNSFALYLGLVDDAKTPRVVANLVEDVKKHDYHLTTGNLCTKYLLETLTEYGYPEVAYKIATQTTYPGWGFMLANGATTLWERWEHLTGDAMNSHNHPMMGSVGSWFYRYLLGIIPDFNHPAFAEFTLHPYIFDELDFVEGELDTQKGVIKSAWKKEGKFIFFDISIPANSTATVFVPTTNIQSLTENGKSVLKRKEMEFIREEKGCAIFRIGSGDYKFRSVWTPQPDL